ncbi:MAG TPA: hypothetical protein VK014_05190 [Cyclobacteriaceae bacterium]|nr:hypothetical protein [Cyclobacteriaceae bacterium]
MDKHKIVFLLFSIIIAACGPERRDEVDFDQFANYWFQGKAEISSYSLTQYRYGEAREGEAVLVFVTEDFSRKKQVKLDDPKAAGRDALKVLKLNKTKDFITGIYPYHMMLSVFTPVYDPQHAVKVNATSQEWCGHTFTQINQGANQYKGQAFSYFESEGDYSFSVKGFPEDDLWNLIRINPNQIPRGKVTLIPSLLNQRLTHEKLVEQEAEITIEDAGENFQVLKVAYVHGKRILKIRFYNYFPFEIIGWEETQVFDDNTSQTTSARRKAMLQTDYWTQNKLGDESLRRQLKLEQ